MLDEQTKQKINEYLAAIKNGDSTKLNPLFEMIGGTLALIARIFLDNPDDDWHVVSEVYRRVGRSILTYNTSRDGYTWLYQIVKNTARSHNKTESKHKTINLNYLESLKQYSPETITAEWIDFCDALKQLDPESKELIIARYIRDIPIKQIARKMRISESAVCQKISKIVAKIKKYCDKS